MGSPDPIPPRPRRRKLRPRYWLRRLTVLLIALVPLLAWRAYAFVQDLPLRAEGFADRVVAREPVYVAVLGVDERSRDTGRSDTLILVRLAGNTPAAEVVSIPRDTEVTLPDGNRSKINAAYAIGGSELTTQVMANLLSIPQPYYLKINLAAFEKIVDKLGGVDLESKKHYVYHDPYQDLHIDIPAGMQHMNGATALKYVRLRYDGDTNDDIGRIKRQQQFMEALRTKLASPASWVKLPDLIREMRRQVTTNIPEGDQIGLAEALFRARGNLHMERLPGTPDDGSGDWILDRNGWSEVTRAWAP